MKFVRAGVSGSVERGCVGDRRRVERGCTDERRHVDECGYGDDDEL